MSDLFGNQIVGFPTRRLIYWFISEKFTKNSKMDLQAHQSLPWFTLFAISHSGMSRSMGHVVFHPIATI